jgi:hypothetical protein
MPSLPASRTTRRLFKLASLGLPGLIAGLISGCSAAPTHSASNYTKPMPAYSVDSSTDNGFFSAHKTFDARQIPALRHPPSPRRLEYGEVQMGHLQSFPLPHSRS